MKKHPIIHVCVLCACIVLVICTVGAHVVCALHTQEEAFANQTDRHVTPFHDQAKMAAASQALQNAHMPVTNALTRFQTVAGKLQQMDLPKMKTRLDGHKKMISSITDIHYKVNHSVEHVKRASGVIRKMQLKADPMPTDREEEVVTLLWSGGVASTYHLCNLVLVHNRAVRPVFLNASSHLDDRQSLAQERATVRSLYTHIHNNYPDKAENLLYVQTITCDNGAVSGGLDATSFTPANSSLRRRIQHAFEATSPSQVTAFDMALALLPTKRNVYDTFLSTGPLEFVLTPKTPHVQHLLAVRKWGTPVSRPSTLVSSVEKLPLLCTYQVVHHDPSAKATSPQNLYAQLYGHLRFVVPCTLQEAGATDQSRRPLGKEMMHRAETQGFGGVLYRTWSCRRPIHTEKERRANRIVVSRIPKLSSNRLRTQLGLRQGVRQHSSSDDNTDEDMHLFHNNLPRRLAWDPCYSCRACMQRHRDSIWRSDTVDKEMRKADAKRQQAAPGFAMFNIAKRMFPGSFTENDENEDSPDDEESDFE